MIFYYYTRHRCSRHDNGIFFYFVFFFSVPIYSDTPTVMRRWRRRRRGSLIGRVRPLELKRRVCVFLNFELLLILLIIGGSPVTYNITNNTKKKKKPIGTNRPNGRYKYWNITKTLTSGPTFRSPSRPPREKEPERGWIADENETAAKWNEKNK